MVQGRGDAKQRIKESLPLLTVVESYVKLRRSGKNFTACCPFHKEKTPSFYVFPETDTFKCFGCGKGGDLFTFVQEVENLDFREALELLARQAGIPLDSAPVPGRSPRGDLRSVMTLARDFFARSLASPAGKKARDYLAGRGLEGAIEPYGLGYAPASWTALLDHAAELGVERELLTQAGLTREGERGPYDYFRDRLIIPICDPLGRVVAFGARTLDGSEPKYLNSPDTPLFTKGRLLFGLDRARKAPAGMVLVVEGYTDQMAASLAGLPGVVAGLGTALTAEQGRLLERYFHDRPVVLLYDGDRAGLQAAERAVAELAPATLELKVALLEEGLDPADLLHRRGAEALVELARRARPGFAVKLDLVCRRHDLGTTMGKAKAVQDMAEYLLRVEEPVRQEEEARRVAGRLGISPAALGRALRRPRRRPRRNPREEGEGTRDLSGWAGQGGLAAQERILEVLLHEPSLLDEVDPGLFTDPGCRRLLGLVSELVERMGPKASFPWDSLLDALRDDQALLDRVVGWRHRPTPVGNRGLWLQQALFELTRLRVEKEIAALNEQIERARAEDHREAVLELRRRRQRLISTTRVDRLTSLQGMEE